jgi:hypothetical protein
MQSQHSLALPTRARQEYSTRNAAQSAWNSKNKRNNPLFWLSVSPNLLYVSKATTYQGREQPLIKQKEATWCSVIATSSRRKTIRMDMSKPKRRVEWCEYMRWRNDLYVLASA